MSTEQNSIEAAIAASQPVGVEPVAWAYIGEIEAAQKLLARGLADGNVQVQVRGPEAMYKPLYTAPPAPAAVPVDGITADWVIGYLYSDTPDHVITAVRDAFAEHAALATHPQPAAAVKSDGVAAIAQERTRQVVTEAMTAQGDAGYRRGQLAYAALAYLQLSAMELRDGGRAHIATASPPACWPWDASWWKPRDVRRDLVRAGALIAAQLDAIDQQAKPEVQ